MDENQYWIKFFGLVSVVLVILISSITVYNLKIDTKRMELGYCEQSLMGTEHTIFVKCKE